MTGISTTASRLCRTIAVCTAVCALSSAQETHPPTTLVVAEVNGAPGWLLDGKPYVPVMAQAGRSNPNDVHGPLVVRGGVVHLRAGETIRAKADLAALSDSWDITCVMTLDEAHITDGGVSFYLAGKTASGNAGRYPIKLGWYGQVCGVMNWLGPDRQYVVRAGVDKPLGEGVALRLFKDGPRLRLEADGRLLGEWTDPDPLADLESLSLGAYQSSGTVDELTVRNAAGTTVFHAAFAAVDTVRKQFDGSFVGRQDGGIPEVSFFRSGLAVYTTWEWGPQMHTVWKEDGSFDWWEVDEYLRKIAAHDPEGRLHLRFNFRRPPGWWRNGHDGEMVHVRTRHGPPEPTDVVSFASTPFWDAAEAAARDLGRFAARHPEGWRLVGVTYSAGVCEFFPHWGEGRYSDYSPAFLKGFREWLHTRYATDAALQTAWQDDSVALDTAGLPTPDTRLTGDWHDFYDPAKAQHRIDFCRYYAEVTTGLITRLAKAFKDGSDGRLYVRPMAGYQPGHAGFRFHAGPHADFATVLNCPWIDGFFMPHDYRGRGHGGYTAFEIPLASVHLHGKTYITEIDDRTHLTAREGQSRTETPWQTIQALTRDVGAALCYASGAEFKDWGHGWYEDRETMAAIRRLDALAQRSVHHDRSVTSEIAVVVNPQSTMVVRDESQIYRTLNHQQMHLCYPRIGAPHDRIMVDDLAAARDYKLYIVQDCLHLTARQRQLLNDTVRNSGKTVLWLYAPGIVSDNGISVDAVSDLVDMKIAVHPARQRLHLKMSNGEHPYTAAVAGGEYVTYEQLAPLFYVDDPRPVVLGMAWYQFGVIKPAFAVRTMPTWTSVYCSVPVLPPAVIRGIARNAGVHIYTDTNDFLAANNGLITLCAAHTGPRTITLPRHATVADALTGEIVATDTAAFSVTMTYGETRIWTLTP